MVERRRLAGEPEVPWCAGWARFWIERELEGHTLTIAATCRFGSQHLVDTALLDTGAQWSVLGGELAELVESDATDEDVEISISTRLGRIRGRLHRLTITLVAEEGEDVAVPATVLLAPAWTGPPVLGYRGFLERLRIGFDPGAGREDSWMFFGDASL